ncbi:aspartokinase 2, chloroplastic-like [Argentina anserina]|uniref:aspartokinase 2, chloroplastic-like n=1 Tax=Argentina anserina TaxID=57926 RepID=UPI0021762E51|nr:aspartokinase 2, chloroplastic-like [Potentilla anserina]
MQVFTTFEDLGISVDVVATSEVNIFLTLDPSKLWSRELIQQASELDHVVEELKKIVVVHELEDDHGISPWCSGIVPSFITVEEEGFVVALLATYMGWFQVWSYCEEQTLVNFCWDVSWEL